jgi:hypothetical protein
VAWLARGLRAAVDDGSGLTSLQSVLLTAVTAAMTGVHVDVGAAELVGAHDFAVGLADRGRAFRERVAQVMVLAALVRRPPSAAAMARVAEFCTELDLDGQIVEVTAGFADGAFDLAVTDFDRNGYLGAGARPAGPTAYGGRPQARTEETGSVWLPVADDPVLAGRWAELGALPPGTIGRRVHDFYRARGFRFPGQEGSAPPLLAQHDWVHVLADYGTTVESELEVFAFIARANDDPRAFSLLAMVVSLFETGTVRSGLGLFEAAPGNLSRAGMAERVADAMRRGALTRGSRDFLALDWFAVADRPVTVVRDELALPPKSPGAVGAGSVGPWEPGGISPYQLAAGRALAEAEGRRYDAHGATSA